MVQQSSNSKCLLFFPGEDFSSAEMLLEALFEEEDAQLMMEEEELEPVEEPAVTPGPRENTNTEQGTV